MKKLFLVLMLFSGIAYGQYPSVLVDLRNDNSAVELQINDLQQTQVDLGFDFPFYDNTYDKAWVTYTGVLNFQDTGVNGQTFCCSGFDLEDEMYNTEQWRNGNKADALSYSIFGLWTDLAVAYNPNPWFKTTNNTATFGWYDIPEFYNINNLNSFEIKLFDTGDIKFRYDEINIDSHNTTVGTAGDLSAGQYNVLQFKQNEWNKDVPMVWTFNTLTGELNRGSGRSTFLDTVNSTLSNYVAVDECEADPKSCGIFDPVASFDGTEVFGDSVFDFVDDPSLNFGPDPFDTYQDTLTTGQATEEFFDGTPLDNFDGMVVDNFDGMVADNFDGSTPDIFSGGSSLQDGGSLSQDGGPPLDNFDGTSPGGFAGGPDPEMLQELDMLEQEFEEFVAENDLPKESFEEIQEVYEEFAPEQELEEIEKQIAEEIMKEEFSSVKKEENYAQTEDMSNFDDNLLITEDIIEVANNNVVKAGPVANNPAGPVSTRQNAARRVDAVDIAMNQIQSSANLVQSSVTSSNEFASNSITQTQQQAQIQSFSGVSEITEESIVEDLMEQNSGSMGMSMDFSMGDTGQTFNGGQQSFGEETNFDFSFGGPSIVFSAVSIEATNQQSDTQDFTDTSSSSGVTTSDQNFGSQTDQAFSSGGSISDALTTTAPPDFSRFNVAPPSQQEQQTTDKADAQATNMSEEQLEQNLDEFASNMQDSGGFTDQSLTVFLMGRNSNFSQYSGQMQDVSFYTDRGMPGGSIRSDRNSMLRMIGTDNKHEKLISSQYGR
tara:strand:+ start:745 stop:3057 length:2313 start_codon:yes stop_codon:yes gene_type:complete